MEDSIQRNESEDRSVQVGAGALFLEGRLSIPEQAHGVVLFPYAIENGHHKAFIENFARFLRGANDREGERFATLALNVFTPEERATDAEVGFFRANVSILSQRITGAANWLLEMPETQNLRICYFGIGIVGAAALQAAVERPDAVVTVIALLVTGDELVLVKDYLPRVAAPVLLFAGQNGGVVDNECQSLLAQLQGEKSVETIESANFFAETAPQEEAMRVARQWIGQHIGLG